MAVYCKTVCLEAVNLCTNPFSAVTLLFGDRQGVRPVKCFLSNPEGSHSEAF